MSSAYPVPRAAFLATGVSQESALAIRDAAERNAVIAELEKNATMEIAGIGDHAVKTAAIFARGADSTRRLLERERLREREFRQCPARHRQEDHREHQQDGGLRSSRGDAQRD